LAELYRSFLDFFLALGGVDAPWRPGASAVAWGVAGLCGAGFVAATIAWFRERSSGGKQLELLLPLSIVAAGLLFSYLALPHDKYRYDGEDVGYTDVLADLHRGAGIIADPMTLDTTETGTMVRKMSRLHLATVLAWHWTLASISPRFGSEAAVATAGTPEGPDPPDGWRTTSLAPWVIAVLFLFATARSWGAWQSTAALGVGLAFSSPAILFHANCLSDHLIASVVIVLGLHLQIGHLSKGRMCSPYALAEGLVVVGAAFYTHWTSLYLLGPLVLLRILSVETAVRQRIQHTSALVIGSLILVLPELPRMVEASLSDVNNLFANYPPSPGLSLISGRHLFANLSPSSLSAFLAPAGAAAPLLLCIVGAIALWRKPPPGGKRVLVVLASAILLTLAVCFTHIHPGSRWLLPIAMWLSLFLAKGLQTLIEFSGWDQRAGRVVAGLLLLAATWGSVSAMNDLKAGWFSDTPPAYQQARRDLPEVPRGELLHQLERWSSEAGLNVIANPGNVPRLPGQTTTSSPPIRLYTPPVITWSEIFEDRPTLYLASPAEFGWSTSFKRDYLTQLSCSFRLEPVVVSGRLVGLLTAPE